MKDILTAVVAVTGIVASAVLLNEINKRANERRLAELKHFDDKCAEMSRNAQAYCDRMNGANK